MWESHVAICNDYLQNGTYRTRTETLPSPFGGINAMVSRESTCQILQRPAHNCATPDSCKSLRIRALHMSFQVTILLTDPLIDRSSGRQPGFFLRPKRQRGASFTRPEALYREEWRFRDGWPIPQDRPLPEDAISLFTGGVPSYLAWLVNCPLIAIAERYG